MNGRRTAEPRIVGWTISALLMVLAVVVFPAEAADAPAELENRRITPVGEDVPADGAAFRMRDGRLFRLPDNATGVKLSPDGRYVHYRMTVDNQGTQVVVNDIRYQLASEVAFGAFDRSSRYLAYTENQAGVWLLDIVRNEPKRHALCDAGDNGGDNDQRHLDRLIGVFDLPDGQSRILWHRRTDSVECYSFVDRKPREAPPTRSLARIETPKDVVSAVSRPTPSGKVMPRWHVTSNNPTSGVIGTLHTADALRRGFQIFAEPVSAGFDGGTLEVIVDGDSDTVVNAKGHTVCSWDGKTGIPCADLLLTTPGNQPALAYIESKTVGRATWHLVRFGRYAGWMPHSAAGEPHLLGEQLAMGLQ
ncbi:MAG: hypothetical protein O7C67_15095 [Gammaproteobacteria bacterium]|nr:hypothetical protein [Gammaproteobacteria bacterium]